MQKTFTSPSSRRATTWHPGPLEKRTPSPMSSPESRCDLLSEVRGYRTLPRSTLAATSLLIRRGRSTRERPSRILFLKPSMTVRQARSSMRRSFSRGPRWLPAESQTSFGFLHLLRQSRGFPSKPLSNPALFFKWFRGCQSPGREGPLIDDRAKGTRVILAIAVHVLHRSSSGPDACEAQPAGRARAVDHGPRPAAHARAQAPFRGNRAEERARAVARGDRDARGRAGAGSGPAATGCAAAARAPAACASHGSTDAATSHAT
jgi:hypothetical protein